MAIASPFVVQQAQASEGDGHRCYQLDRPVVTVTTKASLGLLEPELSSASAFLTGAGGPIGSGRPQSVENPLGTLLAANHRALVEPHFIKYYLGSDTADLGDPCPTLCATSSHLGLSDFIVRYNGRKGEGRGEGRGQGLDTPITTLDTSNRFALCQFVVSYYGNGDCVASVADPLATITTRDRFGLVQLVLRPDGHFDGQIVGWLDILFRMLQPHELSLAHSFKRSYVFHGTKEARVKQIGNSWAIKKATALVTSMLTRPGGMLDLAPVLPPLPNAKSHQRIMSIRKRLDAPVSSKAPDLFTIEGMVAA